MRLNRLKKSLPLGTAEFVVSRGIADEPAFKWWVPCTLHLRDRIIADVNKIIGRITHKHGIELPTLVALAKNLDEKNCNTLLVDAINREIENLKVSFDILEDGAKILVGHNKASGHLVIDVHVALERKDRLVKDGHRTFYPE